MKNKFVLTKIIFLTMLLIVSGFSLGYVVSGSMHEPQSAKINIVRSGPKKQKYIALTFDDGPHPQYTPEILDLLDEYDVKATFFVLGMLAEKYPDILRRQANEGHEIGNHTYSHINIKKSTEAEVKEEFDKTQNIIHSITGTESKVFRPPYGSYDERVMQPLEAQESSVVLWSYRQDSKDWSNPTVDKIVSNTILNIENGDIILFHDYVYHETSNTVEALKVIVPELIEKGYKFVTISELMQLPQY